MRKACNGGANPSKAEKKSLQPKIGRDEIVCEQVATTERSFIERLTSIFDYAYTTTFTPLQEGV